jgi:hypothetical protein
VTLLSRVRRFLARLEERLPALAVVVEVTPFNWGLSPGWYHLAAQGDAGPYWCLIPTLGPVSFGVSLEMPKRGGDEDDYHA